MTAWKPQERVWVTEDAGWWGMLVFVEPREKAIPYIPESVALERERVWQTELVQIITHLLSARRGVLKQRPEAYKENLRCAADIGKLLRRQGVDFDESILKGRPPPTIDSERVLREALEEISRVHPDCECEAPEPAAGFLAAYHCPGCIARAALDSQGE